MRGPKKHLRRNLLTFVVGMALAAGTALASLVMGGTLSTSQAHHIQALMPTTSALGAGSRVTMAGARVGRITKVSRRGFATLLSMEITDKRVLPIPADSRVTLRQRTPVGENYIEIDPGTSEQALGEDDILPASQANEYVDVDQLLSILKGRAQADARQLIQELGAAVRGRGTHLNRTLSGGAQVVQSGADVLGVLSDDRRQVADLVRRLGRVSAAVGERGEAVRVTADRGLRALRAVGARDVALARTLRELPATAQQVRRTSVTLESASRAATPVVADLASAVRELHPAIRKLRPAANQGRNVVKELGLTAAPLRTTLSQIRRLSRPLSTALPDVHKMVCQIAPVARYAEPYTNDVIATVLGLGSASNSYDAVGHLIRLSPVLGENSLSGLPDEVTEAAFTLLRAGLFGKSSPLTWNPYPPPGKIGTEGAAGRPAISGPKALAASGWKYPRVMADC